jgi:hypothetical protein
MPAPDDAGPPSHPGDEQAGSGTHTEHEDLPWTRRIPDHPPRKDSPAYVASRKLMNKLARSVTGFFYGAAPYEDHHGGGLWVKDADGWFIVRNIAGIEWSAQFCADPAKVDVLRLNARRLYQRFPEAVGELGIRALLDTPIRTAEDVARWTDSICNASVPLQEKTHRGVLPGGGGVHHYPTPVAEIALFKYDDFPLWVSDQDGNEVAVAPVAGRGQGDGRVQVLDAPAGSAIAEAQQAAWRNNRPATLPLDHVVSERAFADQYAKLATDQVDPNDPLSNTQLPGVADPIDGGP